MTARILINNGSNVLEKKVKNYSMIGSKNDFIKILITDGGIWDDDYLCFYPYHTINKIEFR